MRFSSFDVYPKTLAEFRQRTLTGAVVSISVTVLISLLAVVEFVDFVQVKKTDHLFVDTSRGQPLRININISFPALPCSVISLDTLDLSGNQHQSGQRSISKTRLDKLGKQLPPSPPESPHADMGGRRLLAEKDHHNHGAPGADLGNGKRVPDFRHLNRPDMLLSKLLAEILPSVLDDKEAVAELRAHIGEGCHIEGSVLVNKVRLTSAPRGP